MRLRKNHVVQIDFLDHMEGGEAQPMAVSVWGRIGSISRAAIVIYSWTYFNPAIPRDGNTTYFTILRSCIKKITRLIPAKD